MVVLGSPAMEESRAGDTIIILLRTLCISTQVPQLRDAAIHICRSGDRGHCVGELEEWEGGNRIVRLRSIEGIPGLSPVKGVSPGHLLPALQLCPLGLTLSHFGGRSREGVPCCDLLHLLHAEVKHPHSV